MGAQKSGPEVVRYGLWRIYALRLVAAGPTWLGEIQRELQGHDLNVVFGTLGPALDQLVQQGLLVRDTDTSGGVRRLRITDLGRQVLATVHADIVGLDEAPIPSDSRYAASHCCPWRASGRYFKPVALHDRCPAAPAPQPTCAMSMISENERARLYCHGLDDVRARLAVISRLLRADLTLGTEHFDYELFALHIRKILEHIAFGTLTANQAAYSSAHNDTSTIWRAKRLLDRIEAIHKEFYPQPMTAPAIRADQEPRQLHFTDLTAGFLDRAEFEKLYDLCSSVIHTRNPFSPVAHINFVRNPLEWADRIRTLLAFHRFRLIGHPQLWIGELEAADGRAHVYIASPT